MLTNEEVQAKLLNLLISNRDLVDDTLDRLSIDHFIIKYKPLFAGILDAHLKGVGLTLDAYEIFVEKKVQEGDFAKWIGSKEVTRHLAVSHQRNEFFQITALTKTSRDELPALIERIQDERARKLTTEALDRFAQDSKSNFKEASRKLADSIDGLLVDNSSKMDFVFLDDYADEFMADLHHRRTNPETRLFTGINEIDDSMKVGLRPGTLTLFAADVGGFKTTMMINLAVNVFKQSKVPVMFVPLEMPKDMVVRKIVAREANVSLSKIEKADLLTDQEIERMAVEAEKWKQHSSKFVILDPDERTTVASIRKAIEKRRSIFQPRLLIVDYISNLNPESSYARQASHEWYGHMCKDLRIMGKKYGFAIISAVQLGRDAIKRLRTQKEGQQTVGSEDLRGSHEFSADADNIYAQVKHPTQPSEKLQLFCIKARYGSTIFGKSHVAILDVNPDIGRISSSSDAKWGSDNTGDLDQFTTILPPPSDDDLSLDGPETASPPKMFDNPFENQKTEEKKPKKAANSDFDDLLS